MIPAYQAGTTIGPIVRAVIAQRFSVIVVDDASTDATAEEARRAGAEVLRRPKNGGKGTALREGLALARDRGRLWVVTMDADGQHLPSEIPRLLEAASKSGTDLVIGNRMMDPRGMPWQRLLTNRFMSWLISQLIGQEVPDTQCGFRWISRRVLSEIRLSSSRFEIESELLIRSARAGYRLVSAPVSSVYRREISFIRPLQDTARFIGLLARLARERRR